jgi:hypothetical protein
MKSNFENLKSIKSLLNNNELFRDLVKENYGYQKRDGSLNIESIRDSFGNICNGVEDLPNEKWTKSYVDEDNKNNFIQISNFGRQRKVAKIPYYQAVQRAIDIWRKNYKVTDTFSTVFSDDPKSCGSEVGLNHYYGNIEDPFLISAIDISTFNNLMDKIFRECIKYDKDTKVSTRGRYKAFSSTNNLVKTLCLIIRRHGLEEHLNEDMRETVLDVIGNVDVNSDYDCYVVLGYDKVYNLQASNGTCAKFTRDSWKISQLLKNYI